MKLFAAVIAIIAGLMLAPVFAADPLRVELTAVDEEPGRLLVTVGAYGVDGRPLQNLIEADFSVTLAGRTLPVTKLENSSASRSAASVVLLVDTSGSMYGEPINQARLALQQFLRNLDPGDEVAVMSFASGVVPLQDFTTDRAVLEQAVASLNPIGDTALYDGIIAAISKADEADNVRKLVVVLSDGQATLGLEQRAPSIETAKASGVGVVAVGLGSGVDRAYLNELTGATGGRFLDAPTPASLRQAYTDLATAIRSQIALSIEVPPSIDRTVPGTLVVQLTNRGDTGSVRRELPPLEGAVAPPIDVSLSGFRPGEELTEPTVALAQSPDGTKITSIEFLVDGSSIRKVTQAPFTLDLDPQAYGPGAHTLKAVVVDERGRTGEAQLPFFTVLPVQAGGGGLPLGLILGVLFGLAVVGGLVAFVIYRYRESQPSTVANRVQPWAVRIPEVTKTPVEGWPEPLPAPPAQKNEPLGRIVVMNEDAIRNGDLDAIREFTIGTAPLSFGTSPSADIHVEDPDGQIAAEEARLWVQKGRLVYHKLTTLSAMATEGVTSGWQILESNEDMRVGPYRILYQADMPMEIEEVEPEAQPIIPADEDSFFRNFWVQGEDRLGGSSSSPDQTFRAS